MNIFEERNFNIFDDTFKEINKEYRNILEFFGNDIHQYVNSEKRPYNISVHLQRVLSFVEDGYVEMSGQVSKVFDSVQQLQVVSENFVRYYAILSEQAEKESDSNEDKTIRIALVLILINNKINTPITKKIQVVLKSMCKQPTVGALVQVSTRVLTEG